MQNGDACGSAEGGVSGESVLRGGAECCVFMFVGPAVVLCVVLETERCQVCRILFVCKYLSLFITP